MSTTKIGPGLSLAIFSTPLPCVQCYRCESKEDDCTDDDHGDAVECEESNSCVITRTTVGEITAMVRDCDNRVEAGCDTIVHGENNRVGIAELLPSGF